QRPRPEAALLPARGPAPAPVLLDLSRARPGRVVGQDRQTGRSRLTQAKARPPTRAGRASKRCNPMIHASPNSFTFPDDLASTGKTKPFQAPVMANLVLTGPGSSSEKRHVVLDLSGSDLRYEPGDAISVTPHNDPLLVETI